MDVSGHVLVLLVSVLSLCEATEYYVRPTEPTDISCPAQPCLTFSQYTSDSDNYFKSNTVFKFLPGIHHMDRPVTIGNVHNMSLERWSDESDEYPHLVAQFSCETENVTRTTVQVNTTCSLTDRRQIYDLKPFGITVYDATSVEVHASSTSKCYLGLAVFNSNNTNLSKVTAMYSEFAGISLDTSTSTHIDNTIAAYNPGGGMDLFAMSNTYISNVVTSYNGISGIELSRTSNTHITNMSTSHNRLDGIVLSNVRNTFVTNLTSAQNKGMGMFIIIGINTHITNMISTKNRGIGIYLSDTTDTFVTKTTATCNGNVDTLLSKFEGQVIIVSSTNTLIHNTSFTDVPAQSVSSTHDPISLPGVIALYNSTLVVNGCNFTRNSVSALVAYASNITLSGNLMFSNNTALAGTAFILTQDSILTCAENSHIYFINNRATNTGGVFYLTNNNIRLVWYDESEYYLFSTCFLNTEGNRFPARFTFVNNSAGKGGDILYGGQVALSLDGDWNCLESFKDISNISQTGLSLISSDPSRVCLCNKEGQPDCLIIADPTPHTVYPGQTINISAVVVGQGFGTVAGSTYAQFLHSGSPPQLKLGQEVQGVTQHRCNTLFYTIFSRSEVSETVLVLTAHDSFVPEFNEREYSDKEYRIKMLYFMQIFYYNTNVTEPIMYGNVPIYLNITLLPCPLGFMITSDEPFRCECNSLLQQLHGIHCDIQEQTIGRSGQWWVGMIQDDNGTNGTVAASEYCPLDYCNSEESSVTLSEPDSQCSYNHSGTLCGGCQPGLSLALGSTHCLQCSNKFLALLIPFTVAGPVLVFSIKVMDLTISQGTLNGLIFYANIVKVSEYIFFPQGQSNPLTVFIAWLNLDLGVETCLFHGLTAYSKTWLQFVFPFYIWSIAGLIIILAWCSDRVAKLMGNNAVPVLATLFLLSYAKLLRTIITALSYTIVYTSHGPKTVWTADGNVDYLGPKHAPLFATSVAVLMFLWLPYTLLLFSGQWLHKCNCRLIVNMLIHIKPFLDAHYGPLKDKHRYWFGALLLMRATILLISALVPVNHSRIVVLCISVVAVVLTHFGHLVYRHLAVEMFDITFFMNLALLGVANCFVTATGGNQAVSAYTLVGVAFIQFVGLVLFKVFSMFKKSEWVRRCLCRTPFAEDSLELYEQAAIEREVESVSEEEDSEGARSIDSLPTY